MKALDWERMLLDQLPLMFLGEVALRVLFAFLLVFLFLKLSGRRGVRQLSLFELVVILTLGSAAGDVAFYEDVPLLPVAAVFICLLLIYRLTTLAAERSPRLANWLEGSPVTIIRDGSYNMPALRQQNISCDEFFMELRQQGVEHLGQVRLGILEVDGQLSLYFYAEDAIRPGLSVLPEEFQARHRHMPRDGVYACCECGSVHALHKDEASACPRCEGERWSPALESSRCR